MKYAALTLLMMTTLTACLADPPAADSPAHPTAPTHSPPAASRGEISHELDDDPNVLVGALGDVQYKAVHFQGGASARARIWTEDDELFVHVASPREAHLYYHDVVLDGRGELTDEEASALEALAASPLAPALSRVPLDLGCAATPREPAALQSLLFPWQLLLKYRSMTPAADARAAAQESDCLYFPALAAESPEEPEDPRRPADQLLLSRANPIPAIFGHAQLDAEGWAQPDASDDTSGLGSIVSCGFGPGNAGCRGACGGDCTSNNCVKTVYPITKCGKTVMVTRYTCGIHQGCIEHDRCYDACNDALGPDSTLAMLCRRECDLDANINHGVCNAYNWSRGYGPHSHEVDFYYHRRCGEDGFECFEQELEEEGRRRVRSTGDPHLMTLDRVAYDFQIGGEFVLLETTAGAAVELQVRQERGGSRLCPASVAYNTAVATRLGGRRVAIYTDQDPALRIDGVPTRLPDGSLPLEQDATLTQDANNYRLTWGSGEILEVTVAAGYLDLHVSAPETRKGQYRGLLGTFDDDPSNDIQLRDGTTLAPPVSWEDLHGRYADSWRVSPTTSLFDYAPGEDASTYLNLGAPSRAAIDELPEAVRTEATQICQDAGIEDTVLLENCVVDVGCTGDPSFAEHHAMQTAPDSQLEVTQPRYLEECQAPDTETCIDQACSRDALALIDTQSRPADGPITYTCPPSCRDRRGNVWGTDVYTNDSSVCRAAIHAGVIGPDGGVVTFWMAPGLDSYEATERNGVLSLSYGAWSGSFAFQPEWDCDNATDDDDNGLTDCDDPTCAGDPACP